MSCTWSEHVRACTHTPIGVYVRATLRILSSHLLKKQHTVERILPAVPVKIARVARMIDRWSLRTIERGKNVASEQV